MTVLPLSLICLLLCQFVSPRSLINDHNFKENVIQAVSDLSGDMLRKYLESNNDAFRRFGGKVNQLAEKILDKQVEILENNLDNIFMGPDKPANDSGGQAIGKSDLLGDLSTALGTELESAAQDAPHPPIPVVETVSLPKPEPVAPLETAPIQNPTETGQVPKSEQVSVDEKLFSIPEPSTTEASTAGTEPTHEPESTTEPEPATTIELQLLSSPESDFVSSPEPERGSSPDSDLVSNPEPEVVLKPELVSSLERESESQSVAASSAERDHQTITKPVYRHKKKHKYSKVGV